MIEFRFRQGMGYLFRFRQGMGYLVCPVGGEITEYNTAGFIRICRDIVERDGL